MSNGSEHLPEHPRVSVVADNVKRETPASASTDRGRDRPVEGVDMNKPTMCPLPTKDGRDCWRKPHPESKRGLCPEHWRAVVSEWCEATPTIHRRCPDCGYLSFARTRDLAELVCNNCGRHLFDPDAIVNARADEVAAERRMATLRAHSPSVVYYLRFGDRIKIGTSTNLRNRIASIYHDEVLAVERGGVDVERKRHAQFRHSLVSGQREWFFLDEALRQHIKALRIEHGEPLAAADRWAADTARALEAS